MRILNRKGFTLVETLVVIGIIAILAAIGTPYFLGRLEQQGFRSAASDLQKAIQHARGTAVKESRDCNITFNTADNSYTIDCLNTTVPLSRYRGRVSFGGPDAGDATAPAIRFNSRGLCTATGSVFLRNRDGDSFYRFVIPITGYAAIYKWIHGAWM